MLHILDWPPLVWTIRVALLILVGASALLFVLLIARYFRWSNIKKLVMMDLPRIKSLGGEFAGTKGEVQFVQAGELRAEAIEARLRQLEIVCEVLQTSPEGPYDEAGTGEASG